MERNEKESLVKEIEDKLNKAAAAVLTDYRGLNVHEIAEFRRELRQQGIEYKVYKNTLMRRAADKTKLDDLNQYLTGPTAIAFGFDDPITAAKLVSSFARTHAALSIKAGLLEGRVIDAVRVRELANLPSMEVLLGKMVGTLNAPLYGLANVLNGPIRGLTVALGQIAQKKE